MDRDRAAVPAGAIANIVEIAAVDVAPAHRISGLERTATCLHLLLHLVRNFLLGLEELGRAAIQADRLALVELALAVVLRDALAAADGRHSRWK